VKFDDFARDLAATLPPDLHALYADGGTCRIGPESFPIAELLSPEEVIAETNQWKSVVRVERSWMFWRLRNGVFAAVFVEGPLRARVNIWNYDGRPHSIGYRSTNSFVGAMRNAAKQGRDWYTADTDYYVDTQHFYHGSGKLQEASDEDVASDLEARSRLEAEWNTNPSEDECDQQHYAFSYMALTPLDRTTELRPFLETADMWIQARACEILGHRRAQWAIPDLENVVKQGLPNGVNAAIDALGRIGSPDALAALQQLREDAPEQIVGYFDRALARANS
jgi:hypothetical protein